MTSTVRTFIDNVKEFIADVFEEGVYGAIRFGRYIVNLLNGV